MKILKTVITTLILLQAGMSFGQTKEETITWLKEKLSTSIADGNLSLYRLKKLDECEMIFEKEEQGFHFQWIFPTDIAEVNFKGEFIFKGKFAIEKELTQGSETSYYSSQGVMISKKELYKPIEEKLKHLATFCRKKK